jgi:DNA-binding MarR family transcriptional regulator
MNDVAARTIEHDAPPREAEATLNSFLDAADVWYERIGEALGKVGLSYPKYEVLENLRAASEPLSLGVIAECQSCARSNITQLVDKLEAEGLVQRVADPEDRRGIRAELTEAGRARVVEGKTQLDVVVAEFAASFSTPERLHLGRLLGRLK